jgi:hypothetical protein
MTNNKKHLFIKIILIIVILLLASWAMYSVEKRYLNKRENNIQQNNDILNSISSIVFNESNNFYTIKATYPTDPIDKDVVMKNIVESWINKDKEDWKIGGETYKSEQELRIKYPDMSPAAYELNIEYTKEISNKFQTVTYSITKYEFTGGAHGNTTLSTFTFDKNKQIKIEDIINLEKNDINLTRILSAKLSKSLGDGLNEDMLSSGLGLAFLDKNGNFDQKKCACDGFLFSYNFQNFSILDEGIKFTMPQYSVAAYAYGMPEVIISWQELTPFLTKEFSERVK